MNQTYIHLIIIIIVLIIFYIINNLLKNNLNERFDNNTTIPKIIIQTWKNDIIPDRYKELILSIVNNNPTYEYLFFTDNDIENFLKEYYPDYYETFLKLPVTIQKIDFFRYIAVYHYGGFYFDLDIECFKSLDPLLKYDSIFGIDTNLGGPMCFHPRFTPYCDENRTFFVGQYAFAAKKNNEFIKILIDNIHNNIDIIIDRYNTLDDKKDLDYVYDTTGPDYVTQLYYDYDNIDTVKILEHPESQTFGDYATHKYMGTWKGWV